MNFHGFDIDEEFGCDGAFHFYRARCQRDGRPVLLRAVDPGVQSPARARALLEHELETCRSLGVDRVLTTLDLVENGKGAVLVLADAPGTPLAGVLRRLGGPLPLVRTLEIGVQIAGTLSALHRRDLVHRDLRPANIIYDEESGQVCLTGLGQASRVTLEAWRFDASERLQGDFVYLAPEATGRLNRQLDYRADLYSLGVMLFEMLTGRLPFDLRDPMALVHAHIAVEPPAACSLRPAVPATVSAIVGRLLAKAAEERYQSGLGLRHDLERCLTDLQTHGEIRPFELGERDWAERFELPQTLFGREAELRWLEEALATAAAGRRIVRLVAGYSGVGKTSLIEEIRILVLRRRGLFASGTFDPSSQATPYDGIFTALRGLAAQKLGARPEQASRWAQRLATELGTHLGIMTEVLPELLPLVGEPPPVPAVQPENTRNRFHRCVSRFLETLVGDDDGKPLVLFLDDLQWIDPASVELLELLLADEGGAFLLLGAYRDNEVDEGHILSRAVGALSARGVDVDTLRLLPLVEPALSQLIAEGLRIPAAEAAPLTELVYRKTAGNPFFARTFLYTLYQHRLLRVAAEDSSPPAVGGIHPRWTWDLDRITALEATENVIELVAHQLTELPEAARRTVAVASMLGKEVDLETLAAVCGIETPSADVILLEACREGLFVKVGVAPWRQGGAEIQRYAFTHDRVREGAKALLCEEECAAVHLRIGRLLRDRGEDGRQDVFEIADHLNHAAQLITDPAERRELVRLNAEAGRQARASGAFPAAFAYLRQALEILSKETAEAPDPWHEDYELALSLHEGAAEAASLAGDFESAERLIAVLHRNARCLLDEVSAYEVQIYMLHARREEEAAICLALDVLGRFGVEIPLHPAASALAAAVKAADQAVEAVLETVETSGVRALPTLRDAEQLAVSRLLARTTLIVTWRRMRLLRLLICRLAELTATHGLGPVSPIGYVLVADVRCGELQDVAGGRRVGELGLELARQPGASGLEPTCRMVFEAIIGGRTVHPADLEKRFSSEHFHRNLESGDLFIAASCGVQGTIAGLLAGSELQEVEAAAQEFQARSSSFGQLMIAHAIERVARLAGVLRGRGAVEWAIDLADVAPGAVASVRPRIIGPEMMVRFLLRQRSAALQTARESLAMPDGAMPLFPFDFYRCLIFLDRMAEDRDADELQLGSCKARLESQAHAAPEIYQHKVDLVRAHEERAAGRAAEALALYEKAIEGARQMNFPQEEALARELAAELCLELGKHRVAASYLDEAVAAYGRWGARAKVDHLLEAYPDLVSAPGDPLSSLDVTSLDRAQRALSGELDLARLLRRLMTLLLQNAGARRGFLLRDTRDQIMIEASGTDGEVDLPESLVLDAYDGMATAIVRYVARTQEIVTLGEADRDPRFASDPYIERVRPRSILCFPLLHRGQSVEIAYLENDRSPDVFSAERVTAVRLLASHAAAALENARLHHDLRQEVETRRRAEAALVALKDRLEVENVYLREEIQSHFEEIVGDSEAMRKVLHKVELVATTDATVLIHGETGTGKELIARALHRLSSRRERSLVKVNCAALPSTLIESELFGHEKGAFTGALSRKAGRFELADSGTLFLDEIGDLPLELQAKLLRVLQEGEFERLGGAKTRKVDVRIIAATNRDLEQAMAEKSFRPDLYYRLTVFPIELPPLRERRGDVPLLAHFFLERKRAKLGKAVDKIPHQVMERFAAYDWPGNVRELENVVERALILSLGETLHLDETLGGGGVPTVGSELLVDIERAHIRDVLEASGWKIKGRGNASERLGLSPTTLRDRMKKLGIVRPGTDHWAGNS